jgi:hypothetical protein
VLAGVVGAILVVQSSYALAVPRTRTHIRPAIEFLREHRQPGDTVWVVGGAASDIYRCYVDPPDALTVLNVPPDHPLPPGRFWIVFARQPERMKEAMKPVLARAEAGGAQLRKSLVVRGGAAFLYERESR